MKRVIKNVLKGIGYLFLGILSLLIGILTCWVMLGGSA